MNRVLAAAGLLGAGLTLTLAGCPAPQPAAPPPVPAAAPAAATHAVQAAPVRAGGRRVLNVWAQAYMPEKATGDNPNPLHEMTRIAREYERLHPDVKVNFIDLPPTMDFQTWITAKAQADLAPEITWAPPNIVNPNVPRGWFLPLDRWLNRPNPHAPGSKRWIDYFYPVATNTNRAADGQLYTLPIDQVETAIFYNKDIFRKAGVSPPATWGEFMRLQGRLQQAGFIPFVATVQFDMRIGWAYRILVDIFWNDRLADIDVRANATGSGFPGVDAQEFVRAVKKGIYSTRDPRYREVYRLLKEWSRYWQRGFLGSGGTNTLFRQGKAAMFWDGSWYMSELSRDKMRAFEFGTFYFPRVTKADSAWSSGIQPRGVGGATSIAYAVTKEARRNGLEDEAVDFLRLVTAPRNIAPLVAEAQLFVPNVMDVPVAPLLQPFLPTLKAGHVLFDGEFGGPVYNDRWFRTLQSYLGGRYTLDQVCEKMQPWLEEACDQLIRENAGKWKFNPDWEILN